MGARVMVMAGGTGGHVYPALAVARLLRERGHEVAWMGAPDSFEARLVPDEGFVFHAVRVAGLRGKGWARRAGAPLMLGGALARALAVLRRARPAAVLGMGGFVSGPGGVAARLLGRPLVIHEQNAVPGLTNRLLARIANRVLEAVPGSFPAARGARAVGNPVRAAIAALAPPQRRFAERGEAPLSLLVLGGSLGAEALNQVVPAALARVAARHPLRVRHQAGRGKAEATAQAYRAVGLEAEVDEFIDDMAAAYAGADLAICRAGALTIAELAAAGLGAVLVPYPHAVDDHQTANARGLAEAGAARLVAQAGLTVETLAEILDALFSSGREGLSEMAGRARALARPDAARAVADACEEVMS